MNTDDFRRLATWLLWKPKKRSRSAISFIVDCSQSPIFPWDRRCDLLFRRAAILVSWCERNWGEYKVPVGRGGGGHGEQKKYFFCAFTTTLLTPPPLPTGILYSSQFRSHQETKMAARRTQRSTFTILRKNRGLWTVYFLRKCRHGVVRLMSVFVQNIVDTMEDISLTTLCLQFLRKISLFCFPT